MTISPSPRFSRGVFYVGCLIAVAVLTWIIRGRFGLTELPSSPTASRTVQTSGLSSIQKEVVDTLTIDEHAIYMSEVTAIAVTRRPVTRHIRTVGVIDYNEAGLATIPSRVDGYLERLFVDQTGVMVRRGDHLAEIYSPDLIIAQQELTVAKGHPETKMLADAARQRLRRYGISEAQIASLDAGGPVLDRLALTAPIDGVVVEKMVVAQQPVIAGMVLYRVANLESVWAQLDIFEQDLGLVRPGQSVDIRIDAHPQDVFVGRISFIDPILRPETRSARARVVVNNPGLRLRPNLYVHAEIIVPLQSDGQPAATGIEGKWTCPMHPEVLADSAGSCPRCAMDLRQIPLLLNDSAYGSGGESANESAQTTVHPQPLVVPSSAVLALGTRSIAWLEITSGTYRAKTLRLGPQVDDQMVIVLDGLSEGDRVVERGAFLIDSEAQIRGLPSLLRPDGGPRGGGHQHGGSTPAPIPAPLPAPLPATSAPRSPAESEASPPAHQH